MSVELLPGQAIDRFVIEAVIGRGGMATVYRARHAHLGTVHAIKVLDTQGRDLHRRLMLEGRTQATLRHANVVAVSDVVQTGNALGLVMEYVAGPSLSAVIDRGPLTLDQVSDIARGMFAGVAVAHTAGVVHRDLKPGNVLLSLEHGIVVPKVTDFGLAKLVDEDVASQHTRSGATMGTPAYMAPEQVRDAKDVDHRADIFALGTILYELLTGRRAFGGENVFDTMQAVVAGSRVAIRDVRPDVSTQLASVVNLAMATDRATRFQNVRSLATAWDVAVPPASGVVWDAASVRSLSELVNDHELGEVPSVLPVRRSGALRSTTTRPTAVGESGSDSHPANQTWAGGGESVVAGAALSPDPASLPPRRASMVAPVLAGALLTAVGAWALWPAPPGAPTVVAPAPDVQPTAAPAASTVMPLPAPAPVAPTVQAAPAPAPTATRPPAAPSAGATLRSSASRTSAPAVVAAAPAPAPAAAPAPEPEPAPAPAAAAAPVPADTMAHVSVTGTTANVWLRSAKGNVRAGHAPIPPGSYVVTAMFPWDPLESTCRHASLSIL